MNRKQFIVLLVALVVLGGAGLAMFWQDIASYRESGAKIGAKILPNLKVSDVAQVTLKDGAEQATLVRQEKGWVVKERGNYPANFTDISDTIIKMIELKAVQSETVSAALLPRINLADPPAKAPESGAKAPEGVGTQVVFADAAGKLFATIVLGKTVLKKDPGNPLPNAQDGVPAGRYVRVGETKEQVVVVGDPLANVSAAPGRWLEKDFFKADRVKTLTVSGEGGMQWKIARDVEYGQWKFVGAGGDLDASAAVGAVNSLASMSFNDIVVGDAPAGGKPVTITAETFDRLTYTIKATKREGGDYLVNVAVTGEPPRAREPEKGEKAEEKERRDKDYAETLKKLDARVVRERALGKWNYVVEEKALAPLLKDRAAMVQQKKPPQQKLPQ